ncbi:MAG: hypothetical protein JXD23_08010 [Spirochaetales bacterium]|nr:hypothetical protein [Spirochaetales bacterium]
MEMEKMIFFISGPSGIGNTDACFSLLLQCNNAVYLDSDWFCAKNPLDPFKEENIKEVFELLQMNIDYH